MNQHDTPAKVASTDGLGPLVADALTAADEYAEAAGHAECWTGTRASYNQHLADARTKARQAIDAAVAAERERCAALARNKALHCDDHGNHYGANAARDIEDAIRGPNAEAQPKPTAPPA